MINDDYKEEFYARLQESLIYTTLKSFNSHQLRGCCVDW